MSLRVSNNNGYTIGYDDGINYADGRVNTNSINYQSGYNSGISYADGRVNTSSINYSTGYNNGINYADSRVNTSSSSYTNGYNSGYSNGKNVLSTLTEMERFLIGMLGRKYDYYRNYDGAGGHCGFKGTIPVPFSSNTVRTINVTLQCDGPEQPSWSSTSSNINFFGYVVEFPPSPKVTILDLTPTTSNINLSIGDPGHWMINSFATVDGKVHTASNLNY